MFQSAVLPCKIKQRFAHLYCPRPSAGIKDWVCLISLIISTTGATKLFRTSNFIGPGYHEALLFQGWAPFFCCLFYCFLSQSCEAFRELRGAPSTSPGVGHFPSCLDTPWGIWAEEFTCFDEFDTCFDEFVNQSISGSFSFQQISPSLVASHLRKLCTRKATGLDTVSARLLRECFDLISDSLALICNRSIETSIFPDEWKSARITPHYKKCGNRSDPSNYRPISFIPVVAKVFERIVFD